MTRSTAAEEKRAMTTPNRRQEAWPELPYAQWRDTCTTLHLWTQIVGKVRLTHSPWLNHSWHATLYVTPRGLTTSAIPYGDRQFQMDFDFLDHRLVAAVSDGAREELALRPMTVAEFHARTLDMLGRLGVQTRIHGAPNEVPDAIPFAEDRVHRDYDPEYANRFWRVLLQADRVLGRFRAGFMGKCSPVHLFWGSFDLAVTRFSGRPAPPHPGGFPNLPDAVTREAYSREVSSAGFWPGGGPTDYAAFYSYAYPMPDGFGDRPVAPPEAFFHEQLGEFLLPYEAVRRAPDPDAMLTGFLQSTYEAAADAAGWDRPALEREPVPPV
jgi:hypothetical protein